MEVSEQVQVLQRNKDDPLPSPAFLWIVGVCERKPRLEKSFSTVQRISHLALPKQIKKAHSKIDLFL